VTTDGGERLHTVLVVEDEITIALLIATVLEDEGHRVLTAGNGVQALERIAENKPDLIVSDLMMPLMDGAELAKALRENPATRDIPIVFMSALPQSAVDDRVDGHAGFLRKPFLEPALLALVRDVLEKART